MAQIFISYARKDRARIEPLARALAAEGWSVWWDRKLKVGKTFEQTIREELSAAHCVIVAWTVNALGSHWVIDEAGEGRKRKILFPVLIDEIEPPLGFRQIHAADLSDWKGQRDHPEFQQFILDIHDFLGTQAAAPQTEKPSFTNDPANPSDTRQPDFSPDLVASDMVPLIDAAAPADVLEDTEIKVEDPFGTSTINPEGEHSKGAPGSDELDKDLDSSHVAARGLLQRRRLGAGLLAILAAVLALAWWLYLPEAPLREWKGHLSSIDSVAFSSDGRTFASGSDDDTVRLWDPASGQLLRELKGHSGNVSSVDFSPDGKILASGSADQTIRLWDSKTGQSIRELKGHVDDVLSVAFSPDGKALASGSNDGVIRFWDPASGQLRRELKGSSSSIISIAFSPDGKTLASGGSDGNIRFWDPASGQLRREVKGQSSWIISIAFSSDGKMLASGSTDNTARLWDPASGQLLHELRGHSNWVRSVAFSPDSKTLASGSFDRVLRFWDSGAGQLRREIKETSSANSIAFSPDGEVAASGYADGTIRLWRAN